MTSFRLNDRFAHLMNNLAHAAPLNATNIFLNDFLSTLFSFIDFTCFFFFCIFNRLFVCKIINILQSIDLIFI